MRKDWASLKTFLDEKADQFNRPEFVVHDPVFIPHQFSKKQDIEIAGFFAALLAWGQRVTILMKSKDLMERMDQAPHDFVLHHTANDLKRIVGFKHRTFNDTDALYFMEFLHHHYHGHESLESAFAVKDDERDVGQALIRFQRNFFSLEHPLRTRKHISTPERKSACKRLNMFLRWMVRRDDKGVDFGIWRSISPAKLICPCDVHVERVARKLKLIRSKTLNWQAAIELTSNLRQLDPNDPVRYDFALFGLGIEQNG